MDLNVWCYKLLSAIACSCIQLLWTNGVGLCGFIVAEDVEVDVESIVFECVSSDGLSITHTDVDHCYSSSDKDWL